MEPMGIEDDVFCLVRQVATPVAKSAVSDFVLFPLVLFSVLICAVLQNADKMVFK